MKTATKNAPKKNKKPAENTSLSKPVNTAEMIRGGAEVPEDMDTNAFQPYVYFWSDQGGESSKDSALATMAEGEEMGLGNSFLIADGGAVRLDTRKDVLLVPLKARLFWAQSDTDTSLIAASSTKAPGMKEHGHGVALLVLKSGDDWVATAVHFRAGRGRVDGIKAMVKSVNSHQEPSERTILRFTSPITPNRASKIKWTGFKAPAVNAVEDGLRDFVKQALEATPLADVLAMYDSYNAEIDDLMS